MKHSNLKLYITSFVLITILFSCTKNNYNFEKDHPDESSLYDNFIDFGSQYRYYTIDVNAGGDFVTEKGTVCIVPPNCFVDTLGKPISNCKIKITFCDIYKKSDMMYRYTGSNINGNTIDESAGIFYIDATAEAKGIIEIDSSKKIIIKQPIHNTKQYTNPIKCFQQESIMNRTSWKKLQKSVNIENAYYIHEVIDISDSLSGLICDSNSSGQYYVHGLWFNSVSQDYNSSQKFTTNTIYLDYGNTLEHKFTYCFIPEDKNTIYPFYIHYNNSGSLQGLPIGMKGTLVCYAIDYKYKKEGNNIIAGFMNITVQKDSKINLFVKNYTYLEFKNELEYHNKIQ